MKTFSESTEEERLEQKRLSDERMDRVGVMVAEIVNDRIMELARNPAPNRVVNLSESQIKSDRDKIDLLEELFFMDRDLQGAKSLAQYRIDCAELALLNENEPMKDISDLIRRSLNVGINDEVFDKLVKSFIRSYFKADISIGGQARYKESDEVFLNQYVQSIVEDNLERGLENAARLKIEKEERLAAINKGTKKVWFD